MLLVDNIRASLQNVGVDLDSFVYGRSFDSALETHIKPTIVSFVFLDPITKVGTLDDGSEVNSISIGFIKQDAPDSSELEREALVDEMDELALTFLTNLYSSTPLFQLGQYSMAPIYRIKNVCSGVLYTFTAIGKRPC